MTAPPGRTRRSARLAAFACSALVLLLPMVVVALSLGDVPGPAERARVERALRRPESVVTVAEPHREGRIVRQFLRTAVVNESWPAAPDAQRDLVMRARLSQIAAIGAMSLVLYLAVMLARGRLQALLACGLFAALPPVATAGHVLRAETPAALFALLSVVLLESAVANAPRDRVSRPRRSTLLTAATMVCAAVCAALACATLASIGEVLLVPAVLLLVVVAQLAVRAAHTLRRRGLVGAPIRALNRRMLPWLGLVLLAPACTVVLMSATGAVAVEPAANGAPRIGLLAVGGASRVVAIALLTIGLAVAVWRVGQRFGRRGRVGPDLVLFVWCALFLLPAVRGEPQDALPMAPAMAVLLSEGLRALLVALLRLRSHWRRRRALR